MQISCMVTTQLIAADKRIFFRYIDNTKPVLHKSEISSLLVSSVAVQPSLCQTWLESLDRFIRDGTQIEVDLIRQKIWIL